MVMLTFFHGNPCQIAKHIVIAGLKCPPDVGAQVMIAKAIPRANAQPTSKKLPYAGLALFKTIDATAAMPGNT